MDALARIGGDWSGDFPESEWVFLDQLIQRLVICQRGLAAESFQAGVFRDLKSIAPDAGVQDEIMRMVVEVP